MLTKDRIESFSIEKNEHYAIAFSVILLIRLTKSTSTYELLIGGNESTPMLNVVAIFMGIGHKFLPQIAANRNQKLFNYLTFCFIHLRFSRINIK